MTAARWIVNGHQHLCSSPLTGNSELGLRCAWSTVSLTSIHSFIDVRDQCLAGWRNSIPHLLILRASKALTSRAFVRLSTHTDLWLSSTAVPFSNHYKAVGAKIPVCKITKSRQRPPRPQNVPRDDRLECYNPCVQ